MRELDASKVREIVHANFRDSIMNFPDPPIYISQRIQWAHIFLKALKVSEKQSCSALEIGVLAGDSASLWIDLMIEADAPHPLLTIDVHSEKGYQDFYFSFLQRMMQKIANTKINWRHFPVPDTIFMDNIYQTLPSDDMKRYFFVNLDGPHDTLSILREVVFFHEKIVPGGIIFVDDIGIKDNTGYKLKIFSENNNYKIEEIPNSIYLTKGS